MERYYKISGLTVKMNPMGTLEKRAEKYLCEPAHNIDIELKSSWERVKSRHPDLDDDTGEFISTGVNFYRHLLQFDGIMLHASTVAYDGKAYLFSAKSGVGKSTHTKLWLELLGEKAYILNDDKPALRLENGIWYAYGTPWSGKYDISVNSGLPIGGIAVLNRSESNSIEPFGGAEAIKSLIKQMNRPKKQEECEKFLELLDKLFSSVPIWKIGCNTELEAAKIAYEAMSGKKIN